MRYTTHMIKGIIFDKYGTELLNEWGGTKNKLKILCTCGVVFEKTWDDINKTNTGVCKSCSAERTKQIKFEAKYKEIEYFFISRGWEIKTPYTGYNSIMKIHKNGVTKEGKFNTLKYQKDFDDGKVTVRSESTKLPNLVDYLTRYGITLLNVCEDIKHDSVIECICSCGETFTTNIHDFKIKKHKGCNKCSPKRRLNFEEVKENIQSRGFTFHSIDNNNMVNFSNEIGNIFTRNLKDIIYEDLNSSTYMKVKSRGEYYIQEYLVENNIFFETEKTFPDLKIRNGTPRFDFYLPGKNIIIEFHGSQHFEPHWDYAKGINVFMNLKKTMSNDYSKEKYCRQNSIKLITINYYELKYIKRILDELL